MAGETKQFRVVHTTEYRFGSEVSGLQMSARLKPLDTPFQSCDFHQLIGRPAIDRYEHRVDDFGNHMSDLFIGGRLQRLKVSAVSTVSIISEPLFHDPGKLSVDDRFLQPTPLVTIDDTIAAYGRRLLRREQSAGTAGKMICNHIYDHFDFASDDTAVDTHALQVLQRRRGVCQDFAHLSIAILRSLGYPARYVSGYLYTAAFRGRSHRIASDVSHAWFEVLDPSAGWVGFDPANGREVDDHYILLATGRDYQDICPLSGRYNGGGGHTMSVSVDVQRLV